MDLARHAFVLARATEALAKTGQNRPPTNLEAIAAHYGIDVVRGPRQPGVAGHFDAARNEIVLGEFDRWPFAHELGHALLRHGSRTCFEGAMSSDAPLADADLGPSLEGEANRFARYVLVPKEWVEFLLSRGWQPRDMPRRFAVSDTVFWLAFAGYGLA